MAAGESAAAPMSDSRKVGGRIHGRGWVMGRQL